MSEPKLRYTDIEEKLDKYIYGIYENLDKDRKNHIGTICPFLVNTNDSDGEPKQGACVLNFSKKENYGILDVPGDGACFYHCMRLIRGLLQMTTTIKKFTYYFDDVISLKTELFYKMKDITEMGDSKDDLDIIKHKVMRYLGRVTKTIYKYVNDNKGYIAHVFEGHRTSDFVKKTREILKLFNAQANKAGKKGIDLGELEYYFFLIMVTLFDIANGTNIMVKIKDYIGTETAETPDINYDVLITCVNATMLETFYHAVIPDVVSIMDMDERGKDTFYNDEFIFRNDMGLCGGCNPMINRTDYIEEVIEDGVVIGEKIRAEGPEIEFFTLTPSFNKAKCKHYFILFNTGGHYQIMMNVTEFEKHKHPLEALYHSIIHKSGGAGDSGSITLKGTSDFGGKSGDIELKPTDQKPTIPNEFIIRSYGRQVGEGISADKELFKSVFPPAAQTQGALGADASVKLGPIELNPIQLPTGDGGFKPNPITPRTERLSYSYFQYVKGKALEVRDFSIFTSRDDIQIDGKTLFNLRFQESRKTPGTFTFFSLPQPTPIFKDDEQQLVFETGEQHKFRISTYEDFIFLFLKYLIVRIEYDGKYVYQNWYTLLADHLFPDSGKLPTLTGLKGLKNGKCIPIKKALQLSKNEASFVPIKAAILELFPGTTVTKFSDP